MNEYKKLKPFKWFILENFPFIAEDFDAITNYQLLSKVIEYLNKTIESTNTIGTGLEELSANFEELKNYIDNYFDNLDIQEEINNKLDEMAEGGEFAEIITAYLNAKSILAYNNIQEMSQAINIIDGSFLRTYGKNSYNDGLGAFYKVRQVTESDVIDNDNIVPLSDNTLIAEKIPDANIINIIRNITQIQENIEIIQEDIENITNEKWIILGDSYSQGYSADGQVTRWSVLLRNMLGLTTENCQIVDYGGTSFANTANSFAMLLDTIEADENVTDIVVCGGYNDLSWSQSNILQGFANFRNICQTKFPKAKIHIGFIGGTIGELHGNIHLKVIEYIKGCLNNNFEFLSNLQYVLYNENYLSSDGFHPNTNGQTELAKAIYMALNGGYDYTNFTDIQIDNSQSDGYFSGTMNLHLYQHNNITILSNYSGTRFLNTSLTNLAPGYQGSIKIGKIANRNGIIGSNYYTNNYINIGTVVIQNVGNNYNGYYQVPVQLYIDKDGYVFLKILPKINPANDGYLNFDSVRVVQIPIFSAVFPTDIN